MITLYCKQGSPEWNEARRGIPTASDFEKILTPGGKISKQAATLAHRKVAERILGYSLDSVCTAAMEAGRMIEPEARDWYAFEFGEEVKEVGICLTDDKRIGASPDGLVGELGLLEIKCPMPHTHVGYLLNPAQLGEEDYKPQVQGQLYVTGRKWLDSVSYCPPFPPVRHRIEREEKYIESLNTVLAAFCEQLDEMERVIRAKGKA